MSFKEIEPKTLKKLHEVEVEILDEIVEICKKHKLTYFLVGGTLLGAVRHKGFIPWDDDLDIGMPRQDYEKFIKICEKELNEKYCIQDPSINPKTHLSFMKVRKNNTIFDEEFISHITNIHKGIFVDIFPLDNIDDEKRSVIRFRAIFISAIVETNYYKTKCYKKIKECHYWYLVLLLNMFSSKTLYKWQKKLATLCKKADSKSFISYLGAGSSLKEIYDKKRMLPVSEVEFEGKKYTAPFDCDYYLSNQYGDYMQLPPVEKRINHGAINIVFDTTKEDKSEN